MAGIITLELVRADFKAGLKDSLNTSYGRPGLGSPMSNAMGLAEQDRGAPIMYPSSLHDCSEH